MYITTIIQVIISYEHQLVCDVTVSVISSHENTMRTMPIDSQCMAAPRISHNYAILFWLSGSTTPVEVDFTFQNIAIVFSSATQERANLLRKYCFILLFILKILVLLYAVNYLMI